MSHIHVCELCLRITNLIEYDLSIKQDNLTVAVELEEDGYEKSVSCEELLLAAYDAISRIFTQKALVKAYYNTNPDTIDLRDEDDPVRQIGSEVQMRKAPATGLS